MNDLTGKQFGLLKPIRLNGQYVSPKGKKDNIWYCECECGNFKNVRASSLTGGYTKSCGCLNHIKKMNKYDLSGKYGIGYDSNSRIFLFDLEDYKLIKGYTWYQAQNGYIRTTIEENGERHQIQMHRLIMNVLDEDVLIDHINGDRFDNRKINLRNADYSKNMQNSYVSKRNTSGFKGVSFDTNSCTWRSKIDVNGTRIDLGSFSDFEEAVKTRLNAEIKYYGEYRKPLDIDEQYINIKGE